MAKDDTEADPPAAGEQSAAYTVLARKHRPQSFDALIGQEAMVRILSNAFERDRVPHAIILTGVRGVGKTTTARIVAKGLNCQTADKPTIEPCGACENCAAIAESRHVDVLEMDAASRTGVGDIREIIESVRYRASQARYKVYIIDEAHMLTNNAFNALLKTLEEPPPHVLFMLATTDIHKVPVTVLSRCMRFDLRRVEPARMIAHLRALCEREAVKINDEALAVIARASEGSVRDALSLLDQAIAHIGGTGGSAEITGETARSMLGLAERTRIYELFEAIMSGDCGGALEQAQALYADSADPQAILRELGEVCHLVSVIKAAPKRADDPTLPPTERDVGKALAEKLQMRSLTRAWQLLLKSIDEAARAPSALAAMEMAIIRMTHVADLPSPEELIRKLRQSEPNLGIGRENRATPEDGGGSGGAPSRARQAVSGGGSSAVHAGPVDAAPVRRSHISAVETTPAPKIEPVAAPPAAAKAALIELDSFEDMARLIRDQRDMKLLVDIEQFVRPGPVRGRSFEFTPVQGAPADIAAALAARLNTWCGVRWVVSVAEGHDAPTLAEQRATREKADLAAAQEDPLVQAAFAAFPTAKLRAVRNLFAVNDAAPEDALPDPEEDLGADWEPVYDYDEDEL